MNETYNYSEDPISNSSDYSYTTIHSEHQHQHQHHHHHVVEAYLPVLDPQSIHPLTDLSQNPYYYSSTSTPSSSTSSSAACSVTQLSYEIESLPTQEDKRILEEYSNLKGKALNERFKVNNVCSEERKRIKDTLKKFRGPEYSRKHRQKRKREIEGLRNELCELRNLVKLLKEQNETLLSENNFLKTQVQQKAMNTLNNNNVSNLVNVVNKNTGLLLK